MADDDDYDDWGTWTASDASAAGQKSMPSGTTAETGAGQEQQPPPGGPQPVEPPPVGPPPVEPPPVGPPLVESKATPQAPPTGPEQKRGPDRRVDGVKVACHADRIRVPDRRVDGGDLASAAGTQEPGTPASVGSHHTDDTVVAIAYYNLGVQNLQVTGKNWNKKGGTAQLIAKDIEAIFSAKHGIQVVLLSSLATCTAASTKASGSAASVHWIALPATARCLSFKLC